MRLQTLELLHDILKAEGSSKDDQDFEAAIDAADNDDDFDFGDALEGIP